MFVHPKIQRFLYFCVFLMFAQRAWWGNGFFSERASANSGVVLLGSGPGSKDWLTTGLQTFQRNGRLGKTAWHGRNMSATLCAQARIALSASLHWSHPLPTTHTHRHGTSSGVFSSPLSLSLQSAHQFCLFPHFSFTFCFAVIQNGIWISFFRW